MSCPPYERNLPIHLGEMPVIDIVHLAWAYRRIGSVLYRVVFRFIVFHLEYLAELVEAAQEAHACAREPQCIAISQAAPSATNQ